MQIKVKTIRNLEVIEKELNSISSGVMVLSLKEDFEQIATNFVYHDKNIYVFIQNKELYKNLKLESIAKFTAIKETTRGKKNKNDKENIYNLFYISVSGIVKNVHEKKLINNIKQSFIQKYSGSFIESDSRSKSFSRLICIDTEELTATEETGV
ncbi:MAG: hypothetical protein IH950_09995 [Bacteroidetes bacterium]|nr:hypothetical protein [Bacteroidota bacterium]